jgi:uncharacterized membrane protein
MGTYNELSGRGLQRLEALSDGVFAFAVTVMVLGLHAPPASQVHGEYELQQALLALGPQAATYLLSFLTLGIFWVGQQTQLNALTHSDRDFTWLSLLILAIVALLPFSTDLLAEHITLRTALVGYWLNVLLLGIVLYITWRHARRAGLLREDVSDHAYKVVMRRIVRAQTLYAIGAALCVWNTYASIAFIVLVQINYAFGSRIPLLARIST